VVLVAALGLWRLPDFFLRMHAPALASTLGSVDRHLRLHRPLQRAGCGSCLHVWLIIIVLSITAPITTIVLARAALFRRRQAGVIPCPHRCGGEAEQWRKRRTSGRQTSACWKRCGRPCLPTIGRPAGVR
jgi:multicomponent K+:H+ antiporter subunit G